MTQTMRNVDFVIYAAALEQVPVAEYNPSECIHTNIRGAENIIALSTDRAANPVNLYGAFKLASDKPCVVANNITGGKSAGFSVACYGNAVEPRGLISSLFKKLTATGTNSLSTTHTDMTHFWITLQQSVDFVLKNFQRMLGGKIFVPKIPLMRIIDLASAMTPNLRQGIISIWPRKKLHEIEKVRVFNRLTAA